MDDKKKKITLGILILIMASVWYSVLGTPDFLFSLKNKRKPTASEKEKSQGIINDETVKILLTKYRKKSNQHFDFKSYQPLVKMDMEEVLKYRDPFRIFEENPKPPQKQVQKKPVKKKVSPELKLQGIIWDENQPNAIINGEIVEKGDQILGYTVHEVRKDRVVLERNGRQKVLWEP